jgi:DNA-binding CsgD family transcriptional regulator
LHEIQKKLENELRTYARHPLIDLQKILAPIETAFETQINHLTQIRKKHPDLWDKDEIRETLTTLLDARVGTAYTEEKLRAIYKEGEERYAKLTPPGYKDLKSKTGEREYGDLVLWYQVIEKASEDKLPIIMVTDDVKEDWWWRHEGRTVGPKPELVEEMRSKAGVEFYMYNSDQFMKHARHYLKEHVDVGTINEVREIRRQDEERRREVEQVSAIRQRRINELLHHLRMSDREMDSLGGEIASLADRLRSLESDETARGPEGEAVLRDLLARKSDLEKRAAYLSLRRDEISASLERARREVHPAMSAREQEILQHLAAGLTNAQIAERMDITEHVVKNYLFRIFDKLGVSSRVEAVLHALR